MNFGNVVSSSNGRRCLLGSMLVALALIVWPSLAQAGNYTALECYPGYNNAFPDLTSNSWDNTYVGFGMDCANGGNDWRPGAVLYARSYSDHDVVGVLAVNAPAGTYFHTVSFRTLMGAVSCATGGSAPYWGGQTVGYWHRDFQPPCNGPKIEFVSTTPNSTQISWSVGCYASLNGYGSCWHEERSDCGGYCYIEWNSIGDLNMEVTDISSPTLSLGGSAFAHQTIAGQVGLDISGADQGSGVRSAWVDVNGQRLATPATSCPGVAGSYATQLRPCGNLATSLTLNTAASPFREGQNSLHVCVQDYATVAGTTANTTCQDQTLNVDNSCADSQGAQQGQASSLSAGFETAGGPVGRSVTVNSTEGTKLTGQLRNAGGGAVGGASICLYEEIDAPAEIRQLSQVTKTRSDGGYALQLPAGPSRDYDVVYRSNDQALDEGGLALRSIAVPTLGVGPDTPGAAQASATRGKGVIRNGRQARFRGQIPGPYAANRVVALEALIGRGCGKRKHRSRAASTAKKRKRCQPDKWRTFKTTRTDSRGRYSDTYRFTQTSGTARYSFRATVPDQAGYPYLEGSSGVQQVTVRGRRR